MSYTLKKTIDLAIQVAVQKAKREAILECRPVGSYFITETEDDPNVLFGGGWQKLTGRYVLQCSDDNHKAGTTVEAGLPDIGETPSFPIMCVSILTPPMFLTPSMAVSPLAGMEQGLLAQMLGLPLGLTIEKSHLVQANQIGFMAIPIQSSLPHE